MFKNACGTDTECYWISTPEEPNTDDNVCTHKSNHNTSAYYVSSCKAITSNDTCKADTHCTWNFQEDPNTDDNICTHKSAHNKHETNVGLCKS